jgi:hypothetical protein
MNLDSWEGAFSQMGIITILPQAEVGAQGPKYPNELTRDQNSLPVLGENILSTFLLR